MLWLLASILLLSWIVMLAFKVTATVIHVLLVAALVLYVYGAIKDRRRTRAVP